MVAIRRPRTPDVGVSLEEARRASGLSYNAVARRLYDLLGEYAPTPETLRVHHQPGRDPEKMDLTLVAALATVYGIKVADLSPVLALRIRTLEELLLKSRCSSWDKVQTPDALATAS